MKLSNKYKDLLQEARKELISALCYYDTDVTEENFPDWDRIKKITNSHFLYKIDKQGNLHYKYHPHGSKYPVSEMMTIHIDRLFGPDIKTSEQILWTARDLIYMVESIKISFVSQLEILKEDLEYVIEKEDYERAAIIRDQIKEFKTENNTNN